MYVVRATGCASRFSSSKEARVSPSDPKRISEARRNSSMCSKTLPMRSFDVFYLTLKT